MNESIDVSNEAKSNAREALKQLGEETMHENDEKDPSRVAGGLKA